ncbi:MAG: hypothetical protein K8R02_08590 [Anaerohalosphaeraceae bacterium]|nr:hypothetical protein [Anaerohalosphaeraceae bacterium]
MKKTIYVLLVTLAFSGTVQARYIEGINWADSVFSHTDKIQSWADGHCGGPGSVLMDANTPATTWLVLGFSDADGNGDMYAWDFEDGDRDYVAGWRTGSPAHAEQEIIVKFDTGIEDVDGNDVVIRMFCGPVAEASVWASTDGNDFVQIGTITGQLGGIPGSDGMLYDAFFDFNGIFADDVNFIRVFREVTEAQSGMFFDSFSAAYIDEPNDCNEVGLFGWALAGDIDQNCYVNLEDFATLAEQWQKCNDPNASDFDESLFEDPNSIPSTCHGVWQAGMAMTADLNHDCRVDYLDLSILAENYLNCNNPDDSNCTTTW